jgi:hypothetical protein
MKETTVPKHPLHVIRVDDKLLAKQPQMFLKVILDGHLGSTKTKYPDVADHHDKVVWDKINAGDHLEKLVSRQPFGDDWYRCVTKWSRSKKCVVTTIVKEVKK